jgi:outer membrane receptor protein involved in Fe transport
VHSSGYQTIPSAFARVTDREHSYPRRDSSLRLSRWITACSLNAVIALSILHSQTVPIVGRIVDATTIEPVSHSVIRLIETGEMQYSDENGRFQFTVRAGGGYTLSVHHLAYDDAQRSLLNDAHSGDTILIMVQPKLFRSNDMYIRSTRTSTDAGRGLFPGEAVSQSDLLRLQQPTLPDALRHSPGLSVVRDGMWETAISIRGMSRSNIVTLVDHTRIETANDIAGALSLINIHDLERVETVRSSGAALYGSGALGGIVHMTTKRASFTDDFQMKGEMNSEIASVNNCVSQYLAVEGSSERSAARISGGYRTAGNTKTPSGALPNSQFTDFHFSGSFGLRTTEHQVFRASYQRSQAENTGISGGSPIAASATATYTHIHRELFGLEYSILNIADAVPSLVVRLSQQQIVRNVEIVQTPALTLTPHAVHTTGSGSVESQIALAPDHSLVLGAEIWQRRLESKRERINTVNNTITGERPVPRSTFLSAGAYGQNEWVVIPHTGTVVFGARYDRISISNDKTVQPEYLITNGILNPAPSTQKVLWNSRTVANESWSANAGAQYSFLPTLQASLLFSRAFRSPSLEERYQYLTLGDGIHVGNPNLQPEQSVGVNAGVQWQTDNVTLRTDVFLNTFTNLVADVPGMFEGSAAFVKQNISHARLYGYEITGENRLSAMAACKYTLSSVRGEDTYNKTNLPFIAPIHGIIELILRHQESGSLSVVSSFHAAQNNTAFGERRTPGYAVFDIDAVSLPLRIRQFTITAHGGVHNIFNRSYRNHLSTLRGGVASEPGRNFFLSAAITV